MIAFLVLWSLFFLVLRRLGVLYPLWLSSCFHGGTSEALDPDFPKTRKAYSMELGFWHNSVFFGLAFLPGVLLAWFQIEPIQLIGHFVFVVLLYGLFNFWSWKWFSQDSSKAQDYLFNLYGNFSELFLKFTIPEYALNTRILGKHVYLQAMERFHSLVRKVSLEQEQKEGERELEFPELQILTQLDKLFHTRIGSVMTPVSRVISLNLDMSIDEALEQSSLYGFSRYPVLKEDSTIAGMFRANQVSLLTHREQSIAVDIEEPVVFQAQVSCFEALDKFRSLKRQVGLVYDNGKWVGLLTLEDLLEEVVGEIEDEFDESQIQKLGESVYLVHASIEVATLRDFFQEAFEDSTADTLNGFLVQKCGRLPTRGSVVQVGKLNLFIVEKDEKIIHKVRIQVS